MASDIFVIFLDDHFSIVVWFLRVSLRAKAMLSDVLLVFWVLFIGFTAVFIDHLVAPVPDGINAWCKACYTEYSTYFFWCETDAGTVIVIDTEGIGSVMCPHVGYVAIFRIAFVFVLHSFRYYRGELL